MAAVPAQVKNVRVYVYFPIRNDTSIVTAQVVWDGLSVEEAGGVLTNYAINITNIDGTLITAQNELVSVSFSFFSPLRIFVV